MEPMTELPVQLRPFGEPDLDLLRRDASDPAFSAPFEWDGYRSVASLRRRWDDDGFLEKDPHYLAVALGEEACGFVVWRDPHLFGRPGLAWEIGIVLAPEHRGQGTGTRAHQLLVDHLFGTTSVRRICANTEAANRAEQRALEKCGFRREGVLRSAGYRGGAWRDVVIYALLWEEWSAPPT